MLFKYLIYFFFIKHSMTKLTAWTHSPFMMKVGVITLQPQKCATCPLSSSPPGFWMHTELGSKQCWASADWLSVRCCRSRPQSKKTLTSPFSSLSSSLRLYLLSYQNWVTWCCSWDRPRSRDPKSNGFNRNRTQFSLRCAQPWWRSAGLPHWSRCIWKKTSFVVLAAALEDALT